MMDICNHLLLDVDQLVTIKGLLIRSSPIIPDMKEGTRKKIEMVHFNEE